MFILLQEVTPWEELWVLLAEMDPITKPTISEDVSAALIEK